MKRTTGPVIQGISVYDPSLKSNIESALTVRQALIPPFLAILAVRFLHPIITRFEVLAFPLMAHAPHHEGENVPPSRPVVVSRSETGVLALGRRGWLVSRHVPGRRGSFGRRLDVQSGQNFQRPSS